MSFSPALMNLIVSQNEGRGRRLAAFLALWTLVLAGVFYAVLDSIARVSEMDPNIVSLTAGLPSDAWVMVVLFGVPAGLGFAYCLKSLLELKDGGPDLRFLNDHRDRIRGVRLMDTIHQTKYGDQLARTRSVLVAVQGHPEVELTVRSRDADQLAALLRSELGIVG